MPRLYTTHKGDDLEDFFELLYGDGQGYMCIVTDQVDQQRWFAWPQEKKLLTKYAELRVDEEVWCTTTLFSEKQRTSDNATEGRVVYADADSCVPSNFRVAPSIAVETSPNRWQTYWLLDKQHTASEVIQTSHKVAVAHREQGCDQSGWIPTKLLRVPGTMNLKYPVPFRVTATVSGDLYSLDEINEAYKDIDTQQVSFEVTDTPILPADALMKATGKIPESLWGLYANEVQEGQSWSERMWKLQLELFREGLTAEEVFVISKHAKCNKYGDASIGKTTQTGLPIPRRQDPDGTLWREVLKAEQSYTLDEQPPPPVVDKVQTTEISFLTDEERKQVPRTFIDEYVDWVATRTDAAKTYSRSLALMLLSCVYGSWGFIHPQFGPKNLNLWVLILGDTTRTRKSTAKSMFLKVLHAWERRMPMLGNVDIGTDVTQEALGKELGSRDGQVSLVHRDEVQGYFKEIFTKSYLSGLTQYLAGLYDGNVPVTLRATEGRSQKKRASTIFNFLGVGIMNDVAKTLTQSNFRDGFLARFVWAVADPPMLTRESSDVDQGDVTQANAEDDLEITEFCNQFARTHRHLGHGEPKQLLFDEPTLKRFNQWKWQLLSRVQESIYTETLSPSVERLSYSVWVAAALLAMHEQSTVIRMPHLLAALSQAEYWYYDMERMVGMIASSDFQRKVDSLENFVAKGKDGRRTIAVVYQNMLKTEGLRKGEVDEIIDNLRSQGRIKTSRQVTTMYLEVT